MEIVTKPMTHHMFVIPEEYQPVHLSWTIKFPVTPEFESFMEMVGICRMTRHEKFTLISGNKIEWWELARLLTNHPSSEFKQAGTFMIQKFPEIYRGISTRMMGSVLVVQ